MPAAYPECKFPVIAKPDASSGSRGIKIFEDISVLNNFILQTKNMNPWKISGVSLNAPLSGIPFPQFRLRKIYAIAILNILASGS